MCVWEREREREKARERDEVCVKKSQRKNQTENN